MEVRPELISEIRDQEFGFLGYLVVDSTINNMSWGGVRILPEITLEEMLHSARIMTLKFAFLGYPIGGAKAGVIIDHSLTEKRKQILQIFGRRLKTELNGNFYMPGIDMGASVDDLREIAKGAGFKIDFKEWKDVSHIYTSWSMLTSAKEALKKIGKRISDCKIAIEGFGKVGGAAAKVFSEEGAKVIAISNYKGAVYNQNGLDVNKLLGLREHSGDEVVYIYGEAEKIKQGDLCSLQMDILLPCARLWSIDLSNMTEIKAKLICPGANLLIRDGLEKELFTSGIMFLPSFVANSGGVLGSIMRGVVSDEKIKNFIDNEIGRKVRGLIAISWENNRPMGKIAREKLENKFIEMKRIREGSRKNSGLKKIIYNAFLRAPQFIAEPLAIKYYKKMMRDDE